MSGAYSWRPLVGSYVHSPNGKGKIIARLDNDLYACVNLNTDEIGKFGIGEITPMAIQVRDEPIEDERDLSQYSEGEIEEARAILKALKPLLGQHKKTKADVQTVATKLGKTAAWVYTNLKRYQSSGTLTSLIKRKRGRKLGSSVLSKEQNLLVEDVISNFHFTREAPFVSETYKELQYRCQEHGITPPHINTLRNRISITSIGNSRARLRDNRNYDVNHRLQMGDGEIASAPRQATMIDHTPADIQLVSDDTRTAIGRPVLTFCIDVYSRLITGYHVGFEPAGLISVALALQMSVLPKNKLLKKYRIEAEWPAIGLSDTLYVDNAMEFRSNAIGRACSQYGIDIVQRPTGMPHIHGIIERNFRTQNSPIHSQPGTTKSNVSQKADYDSESKAIYTLSEFYEWIAHRVIEFNHSIHQGINAIPQEAYKDGLHGSSETTGAGSPRMPVNPEQFYIDFLPYKEAQVLSYGIVWDYLEYRDDVLKSWVGSLDPKTKKPRKFIVRRDPRDLMKIYFWDPELKRYFTVRCTDLRWPAITKWEWDQARKDAKALNQSKLNQQVILNAYAARRELNEKATKETRKAKRNQAIKNSISRTTPETSLETLSKPPSQPLAPSEDNWDFDGIDGFEVGR